MLDWCIQYLKSMGVPVIISIISLSEERLLHLGRKLVRLPALKHLTLCSMPVIMVGNRVSNLLTSSITVCNVVVRLTCCPLSSGLGSTASF